MGIAGKISQFNMKLGDDEIVGVILRKGGGRRGRFSHLHLFINLEHFVGLVPMFLTTQDQSTHYRYIYSRQQLTDVLSRDGISTKT